MAAHNVYILSIPTLRADAVEAVAAVMQAMPHHRARPMARSRFEDAALLEDDLSFDRSVPCVSGREPWTVRDGRVEFHVAISSPRAAFAEGSPETRHERLLRLASDLSSAPDGSILGGWIAEHIGGIHPLVQAEGMVAAGYSHGDGEAKPRPSMLEAPQILPEGSYLRIAFELEIDAALVRAASVPRPDLDPE